MDTKLQTFLTLCDTMNYHAAADLLHLTQPAVTRQIQALEAEYRTHLFRYCGRQLSLTEAGCTLEQSARSIQYNYETLRQAMSHAKRHHLRIGATKTIGEYVLPDAVLRFAANPQHEMTLIVDNTAHLLHLLDRNELDFLVLEGVFDKQRYGWMPFRSEPFIGICAPEHPFAGQEVPLQEVLQESLIVREPGSGTRDILERQLHLCGYQTTAFRRVLTISSFPLIRRLIAAQHGISFLYQAVVDADPTFARFTASPLTGTHEFHIVYLPQTKAPQYAEEFFSYP